MIRSMLLCVLTGAAAGVCFELFANEIPYAALLNAAALHVWVVMSGIMSTSCFQYLFKPKIPYLWSFGVVILSYSFLYFKSQAMESLPMPVFIVCSNMKLLVSLVLDYTIFATPIKSINQIFGIVLVTVGCILITLQSRKFEEGKEYEIEYNMPLGLMYVTLSVITVSLLMPISNIAVTKHGGGTFEELQFMQHFLSLPLFYPNLDRLWKGWQTMQLSSKVWGVAIPQSMCSFVSSLCEKGTHAFHGTSFRKRFCDFAMVTLGSSSIDIPVAFLCLIGTMFLTPIHRKQISWVSIETKSSITGQLIVCAVKTVVLLSLFAILFINSNPSAVILLDNSESEFQLDFDNIISLFSSSMCFFRFVVASGRRLAVAVFSSTSPQIMLGVLMQVFGTVIYIQGSSSCTSSSSSSNWQGGSRIEHNGKTTSDSCQVITFESDDESPYADGSNIDLLTGQQKTNENVLDFLNELSPIAKNSNCMSPRFLRKFRSRTRGNNFFQEQEGEEK